LAVPELQSPQLVLLNVTEHEVAPRAQLPQETGHDPPPVYPYMEVQPRMVPEVHVTVAVPFSATAVESVT
jgi:hypothetical protein